MGIRETLNEKKGVSTAVAIGFVAIAIALIVWQVTATGGPSGPAQLFFTTDEGQTYFGADASSLPPFDHDGKQAVRAHVYECNGKPFVAYVERYKPEAKKALLARAGKAPAEAAPAEAASDEPPQARGMPPEAAGRANYATFQGPSLYGRELKRPGEKDWTSSGDFAKAAQIQQVKCPDGSAPEPVTP